MSKPNHNTKIYNLEEQLIETQEAAELNFECAYEVLQEAF